MLLETEDIRAVSRNNTGGSSKEPVSDTKGYLLKRLKSLEDVYNLLDGWKKTRIPIL